MKPRLRLVKTYWDCGHIYELWYCHTGSTGAYANTPKSAYDGWQKALSTVQKNT